MSHPENTDRVETDLNALLRLLVGKLEKADPIDLFERLTELRQPLEDLTSELCEHNYQLLANQFLGLCNDRGVTPSATQFEGWLLTSTKLQGYLLEVLAERFEQDLADAVQPKIDSNMSELLERLGKPDSKAAAVETVPESSEPASKSEIVTVP